MNIGTLNNNIINFKCSLNKIYHYKNAIKPVKPFPHLHPNLQMLEVALLVIDSCEPHIHYYLSPLVRFFQMIHPLWLQYTDINA